MAIAAALVTLAGPSLAGPALAGPATAAVRAAAGSGWRIVPSPNARGPNGNLSAVSCGATTACEAVGQYQNGSRGAAQLAEGWDGTAWKRQPTPLVPGTGTGLLAVSCPAANYCEAVGSYGAAPHQHALTEVWNGTSWSVQPGPAAGTGYAVLAGVSCTAADACEAVGYQPRSRDLEAPFAAAWDGTAWTAQPIASPPAGQVSELGGVACAAAGSCVAVGSHGGGSRQGTLVEAWNGTAWTKQPSPDPSGAQQSALYGVSCPSAAACEAVGGYESAGAPEANELTLAEAWNGTRWTLQPAPSPGLRFTALGSVSCRSAGACEAVGYQGGNSSDRTLAEVWTGTRWKVQPTAHAPGSTALTGVACPAPDRCEAVGDSTRQSSQTLAESWDGTGWARQPTPDPSGPEDSSLTAVSCSAPDACTAVGGYVQDRTNTNVTLAEVWNGTSWAIQRTPNPPGAVYSALTGVSCLGPDSCVAVGTFRRHASGPLMTLAEGWDGTNWQIQPTPNPAGAQDSSLAGVSCAAAAGCEAVGVFDTSAIQAPLAMAWDGTTWTLQAVPVHTSGSTLGGVSCAAPDACEAVGAHGSHPLAEGWNGSRWQIQPTPHLAATIGTNGFTSVSCPGPGDCEAVGSDNLGGLAEVWNGTSWTVQPTPAVGNQLYPTLSGVSCSAAASCEAVGHFASPHPPLAEGWNGTQWKLQSVPAQDGELVGVSCPRTGTCTAVGGVESTLTMSYGTSS